MCGCVCVRAGARAIHVLASRLAEMLRVCLPVLACEKKGVFACPCEKMCEEHGKKCAKMHMCVCDAHVRVRLFRFASRLAAALRVCLPVLACEKMCEDLAEVLRVCLSMLVWNARCVLKNVRLFRCVCDPCVCFSTC